MLLNKHQTCYVGFFLIQSLCETKIGQIDCISRFIPNFLGIHMPFNILLVMLPLTTIYHILVFEKHLQIIQLSKKKKKNGNPWKLKWLHLVGKYHSHHKSISSDTMFLKLVGLYIITFPNTNTPHIMEETQSQSTPRKIEWMEKRVSTLCLEWRKACVYILYHTNYTILTSTIY